ncbi:MAG: sigma 54-interacting transcriptional regulator [Candidatus Marinimicrobia bacterium]|nr:sigma 54-interacting transcriptional regulator [Candidatus Neomarinimicrobiota bacterium]MCF7839361.1 sigma 54-interacting transcriptional regulator [Candidatus Neomarinimicrobiota bacterium]MCF7901964.1 sigma 54-interacting transcriptional regulator [Candidatus Neomarinimicrobiota bacterium]
MSSADPRLFLLYRSLEELADLEFTVDSCPEAFETIQQVFMGVLGVSRGAFLVKEFEKEMCEVAYKRGLNLPLGFKVPVNGLGEEMEETLKTMGVAFILPMYHHNNCVGLVLLGEKMNGESFTLEDRKLVQPIANLVGMVLTNFLSYYSSLSQRDELQTENKHLKTLVETRFSIREVVGVSAAYQRTIRQATVFAQSNHAILLVGDYGTGKEFLARLIHHQGPRSVHPIYILNADTVSKNLWLRQHPKDLSPEAQEHLTRLRGGTVVILGIDEIPREDQQALMASLGSNDLSSIPKLYNFRMILTARRDPDQLVAGGLLIQELRDHLKGHVIELAPLSERREAIPILAQKILETLAVEYGHPNLSLSPTALRYLTVRDYAENVRELENLIERAVVTLPLDKHEITLANLQPMAFTGEDIHAPFPATMKDLEELKEEMVLRALARNNWKKVAAAESLGVSRQTIDNLTARYKISRPDH